MRRVSTVDGALLVHALLATWGRMRRAGCREVTLLAGIFSRVHGRSLEDEACEALVRALSRNADDERIVFRDARVFLVKTDIGAFGDPAVLIDPGVSVTMLAGEPLFSWSGEEPAARRELGKAAERRGAHVSRSDDVARLHERLVRGDWHALASARGVYCAAHYQASQGRLSLIADKTGTRPIYYHAGAEYVVFASALRILEQLGVVPREMDLRAVTEIAVLGYPLANRTPYAGVSVVRPGEVVHVAGERLSRAHYWRWDSIPSSGRASGGRIGSGSAPSDLLEEASERFKQAVARRLGTDRSTVAFLSGGLDSRCVVAVLRELGATVHSFNFGLPGTQDQVFGDEFARQAGTIHSTTPMESANPDWSGMMSRAWASSEHRRSSPPERPRLVWSGDGGSVALGHVYMSRELLERMRSGRTEAAIEEYLPETRTRFLSRLLEDGIAAKLARAIPCGIREEIDQIQSDDPGRTFHLFLMLNDQFRHLHGHFEEIDLHRIELQLPFYDSDFLASILSAPVDECLGHRLYLKWLAHLPPLVSSVAWQTYPGHEPCPLPVPEGVSSQWDRSALKGFRAAGKRKTIERAMAMLASADFPDPIMNKRKLRIASWISRFGIRDYTYVLRAASIYHKYWKRSGGRFKLPPQ